MPLKTNICLDITGRHGCRRAGGATLGNNGRRCLRILFYPVWWTGFGCRTLRYTLLLPPPPPVIPTSSGLYAVYHAST